jgi:protein-disulfide isomerase
MRKAGATLLTLSVCLAGRAAAQEPAVADITRMARSDILLIERADAARTVASESAEVTLDEFIDFACPDCSAFYLQRADSLDALVEAEDLQFTIRVYPIPRLLRGFQAAEAAFCAGALADRPGFLGMVDQLHRHQEAWRHLLDPTSMFEAYAANLDLPTQQFTSCLARDAMAPLIISDIRLAMEAGIPGTPTFVFNKTGEFTGDELFYDNQPMSRFRESIERVRGH